MPKKDVPPNKAWTVEYTDTFKKQFNELPEDVQEEITRIINKMKKNPEKYIKEHPEQFVEKDEL